MNAGNITFVLICSALVLLMTPGLSLFYGGLVRRKNDANTMLASVFTIGLGIVMWMLFGFSLTFGKDHAGIIGSFEWFGLNNVSLTEPYTADGQIPNMVFCIFQMMFAVITPALITGSVAGRMKFKALFIFTALWSLIVYYPVTHMVWAALIIGLTTSPICYFMVSKIKQKFGYDDALDAFGCHGVCGIWGGICTGLFAQQSINSSARWNGLVFGDIKLFGIQIAAIAIMIALAVAGTLVCYGITKLFGNIRVSERAERIGLDKSELGENAYPSFNGFD